MSQHDTLTQALQDAASSLETISRLAGKAAHPNGDETCMGTFPEVRGYATSRAAVARAALSATQPAQAAQSVPGVNKAVQLIPGMTKEQFAYVHHCALEVDAAKAETACLLAENAALKAQAAQGEPTLKPEQVVEAFNLHFPNTRMAQAYIGFATDLWALGVKAQRAWQPAAGADVLDAERYRWLRDVDNVEGYRIFNRYECMVDAEKLDAAIDAAIAASGRQT